MTMERKIEKMLAPHHVIWLGDDTVGRDAKPIPQQNTNIPNEIKVDWNTNIPSEIKVDWGRIAELYPNSTIPSGITITSTSGHTIMCSPPMAEWDGHTIMCSPPMEDQHYHFDINACPTDIEAQISKCLLENDFIVSVESEGWNLDL